MVFAALSIQQSRRSYSGKLKVDRFGKNENFNLSGVLNLFENYSTVAHFAFSFQLWTFSNVRVTALQERWITG